MNSLDKVVNGLILIPVVFFLMTSNVLAQTEANEDNEAIEAAETTDFEVVGWTFGMGISFFAFDQDAATKQDIGDTAFSVDLYASYYFASRFAATAGIGFVQLDDNAKFEEQVLVTDIFGSDVETATSDASGIQVFGELIYIATNASSPAQFKAGVGYGSIPSADRSIESCSDCTEIDIDLEGGPYATASLYRGIQDDSFNIGLSARQYFSGDIKNTATLWFEYIY